MLNFSRIINTIWLFLVGAKDFVVKYVIPAIHWTELIKAFVMGNSIESELVRTILTRIFPGLNIDEINSNIDSFTAKIATAIRNLFPDETFSAAGVADADTISGFISWLTSQNPAVIDGIYHALASMLVKLLSGDTKAKNFELDTVVQMAYANNKTTRVNITPVIGTPVISFAPAATATAAAVDTRTPSQKCADTIAANKAAKLNGKA